MTSKEPRGRTIVLVLALFAARLALCVLEGAGTGDESWFLRVVDRVVRGDALYRDVFFGSTPFAVQVAAAAARLGGTEAVVVKAVWAAASAATALVCLRIARRCGVTTAAWLVALPFVVWPLPDCDQLYGTMSLLFQLVALDATLAAAQGGWRTHAVAGAAAGLAFATKPNVGAYTLCAVLAGLALAPRAAWGRRTAAIVAGFVAAAAVPLVPTVVSGGWTAFADYVFLNKVTYLRVAGESYAGQVAARMPWRAASAADIATRLVELPVLFALPVAALALAAAARRADGADRRRLAVVGVFLAAAAAFVYPRANFKHLSLAMAAPVLAGWIAWSRLAPSMSTVARRRVRAAATAWLLASAAWMAVPHVVALARGRERFSDLPHFAGVVTTTAQIDAQRSVASALAAEARDGNRPYFVGRECGFFQLVGGVPNPTPFDYPYATSMGRAGEADTIAAMRAGRIGVVFLDPRTQTELAPAALETFVRTAWRRDGSAGPYEVWRAPR